MFRGESAGRERRRYVRYRTPEGVYAAMPDSAERVGPICNISRGGLMFQYLADEGVRIERDNEPAEGRITIFLAGQGFLLRDIACRTVHDQPSEQPDSLAYGYCLRHCGVAFVDLPEYFAQRLDMVMEHCVRLEEE